MQLKINLPFSMYDYKLSGVYKITFEDGSFYIGCSCHLRSRASVWSSTMRTGKGVAGEDIGTKVIAKIRELSIASFDIVELCSKKDLKDKESFYLDKHKDNPLMVSSNEGAWKPVLQYKKNGLFIKKHFSIMGAVRYVGCNISGIQRVLNGERKSHRGMVYVYEHDYHKRRKEIIKTRNPRVTQRKKGRKVIMIGNDGVAIKEFQTIRAAAKEVKCEAHNVSRVLNGVQKTAKGYFFKYA